MKTVADFRLIENQSLSERLFLLRLTPADGSPLLPIACGQFVEVRIDNTPDVFLRRPISVHFVDLERNELHLLVQSAGKGTRLLQQLPAGAPLNIVYPLGNGYTMPAEDASAQHYLLIGGGVGIAPLLQTGATLSAQGHRVTFLLGGRTAQDIVRVDEYSRYGKLCITTEDGSTVEGADCVKGFVTHHPALQAGDIDAIRVCGPMPMMKAVARLVQTQALGEGKPRFCEVSLENKMACGLGVCLCCVEDTKEGHKCVCSEGPVFDINDLKW